MPGLAVYVKEGLPFARDLSLENSADSYLYFRLALLHSVSYFFFLYRSPSSALCTVFDSISSNIDDVLSINPILFHLTQMRFSRSIHLLMFSSLDWTGLPFPVELIGLMNSVIILLSQMTLPRWFTFLLGSLTAILIVPLFWIYLFLTLVFVLQWLSLHWEILIMLLSQFPLTFHQSHNGMPRFIT